MTDQIGTRNTAQSLRVVCANCQKPIYECLAVGRDFSGAEIHAADMVPADPSIPAPQEGEHILCPLCGEPFYHVVGGGAVLELEGGAYWPHPLIEGRSKDGEH